MSLLVAYFSWGGTTRIIAEQIQKTVGGDLFEIKTLDPYPKEYNPTTAVAKREQRSNARPALTAQVNGMDSYKTIFLGYPNWWGTIPMAIVTFLESYNFSGKLIIPFCTHGGSALGRSIADIKKLCPQSTIGEGLAIRNGTIDHAGNAITVWLRQPCLDQPK
ncbi:flavodoxin [Spirochaetia bacterium]|nr:flavodoxin [Spirochaetia bacterium]GHU35113.1 flavodoxin [Spirochaetia bacterium]